MPADALDELDYGILHLLQGDARHTSPVDTAKKLPVTDTTIRNRIQNMEDRGVIEKYVPVIDCEKAGFPLRVKFSCTAPVEERSDLAREALQIPHVVDAEKSELSPPLCDAIDPDALRLLLRNETRRRS